MAQQTITKLIDDLDGNPADETVEFALDGAGLVIDLSARNAARLRGELAEYVQHARRVGGRLKKGTAKLTKPAAVEPARQPAKKAAKPAARTAEAAPAAKSGTNGEAPAKPPVVTFLEPSAADVRKWAKGQRIPVQPRGRIPDHVMAAFKAASRGREAIRG
jgi:hypothetical protein